MARQPVHGFLKGAQCVAADGAAREIARECLGFGGLEGTQGICRKVVGEPVLI